MSVEKDWLYKKQTSFLSFCSIRESPLYHKLNLMRSNLSYTSISVKEKEKKSKF